TLGPENEQLDTVRKGVFFDDPVFAADRIPRLGRATRFVVIAQSELDPSREPISNEKFGKAVAVGNPAVVGKSISRLQNPPPPAGGRGRRRERVPVRFDLVAFP